VSGERKGGGSWDAIHFPLPGCTVGCSQHQDQDWCLGAVRCVFCFLITGVHSMVLWDIQTIWIQSVNIFVSLVWISVWYLETTTIIFLLHVCRHENKSLWLVMFLQNSKSVPITLTDWENVHPFPSTTSYSCDSLDFDYIFSFFCTFKKFWLH